MDMVQDVGSTRLYRSSGESGHQQAQRWFNAADITVSHQSNLLKQLDQQRRQELFCDCSVLVEGQLFQAHRNVLFASSGYFRMLLGSEGPTDSASATFDAFSPETFGVILDFIYSGQLDLSSHNVIEVMSAASYLQMNSVINYCKTFIKSSLEISVKEEEEGEHRLGLMEARGFPCGAGDDVLEQEVNQKQQQTQTSVTSLGSVSPPPALWTHDGARAQQVFMVKDPDQEAPALVVRADLISTNNDCSPASLGLEEASVGLEHLQDPLDPLFTLSGPERRQGRGRGTAKKRAHYYTRSSTPHEAPEVQEARTQKAEKAEELYATLPTIVGVIGHFHKDTNATMRFKCPFCTHTVKRKADLKRHLRCHTGERPYPCQACNKRFTRLEHLRSHFETIHQARKLVCRKCKCQVTEETGQVVCEGTRRYRMCTPCIQEVGCDNLPALEGLEEEPALLLGVDGEEEGDTQRSWMMSEEQEEDDGELAEDSGTDLIIQEVDDSDEEVQ